LDSIDKHQWESLAQGCGQKVMFDSSSTVPILN
jgi:uncharacterized cysteine cluster protein YcgN (CxxCxxCC family)